MQVAFADAGTIKGGKKRGPDYDSFYKGNIASAIDEKSVFFTGDSSNPRKVSKLEDLTAEEVRARAEKEFTCILLGFRKERECAMCGQTFTIGQALGRRQCAWHSGKVVGGAWTCCDRRWKPHRKGTLNGCKRSDHYHRRFDPTNPPFLKVPIVVGRICEIPQVLLNDSDKGKRKPRKITEYREVQLTTEEFLPEPYDQIEYKQGLSGRPMNHLSMLRLQGVL